MEAPWWAVCLLHPVSNDYRPQQRPDVNQDRGVNLVSTCAGMCVYFLTSKPTLSRSMLQTVQRGCTGVASRVRQANNLPSTASCVRSMEINAYQRFVLEDLSSMCESAFVVRGQAVYPKEGG